MSRCFYFLNLNFMADNYLLNCHNWRNQKWAICQIIGHDYENIISASVNCIAFLISKRLIQPKTHLVSLSLAHNLPITGFQKNSKLPREMLPGNFNSLPGVNLHTNQPTKLQKANLYVFPIYFCKTRFFFPNYVWENLRFSRLWLSVDSL